MSRWKPASVVGEVRCSSSHGDCVPKHVHRLDPDLELCVCQACGHGWVRDIDVWDKLNELMKRIKASNNRLQKSLERLNKSLLVLGDSCDKR